MRPAGCAGGFGVSVNQWDYELLYSQKISTCPCYALILEM
jgi:hypothetical protein